MSDSAVITTRDKRVGIYVHSCGSPEYIVSFLKYCSLQEFRPPEVDDYGWARLCQVIGNFFPFGMGMGINAYDRLCIPFDNGDYIIEDWTVVGRNRVFSQDTSIEDCSPSLELLRLIDLKMPLHYRLGSRIEEAICS